MKDVKCKRAEISKIQLLFIIFLLFFSCENKEVSQGKIVPAFILNANNQAISQINGVIYYKNKLFSGFLEEFYENKKIASRQGYWLGKLEGKAEKFYPNGQKKEIRFYRNDQKTGRHVGWWDNGRLQFDYFFTNDIPVKQHQVWYRTGQIYSSLNYDDNGHPDGSQQLWYDDGKIKANYVVKNGRRFGLLGAKGCSGK